MTRSRSLTGALLLGALVVGPPAVTGCLDGGLQPVARDTTPPRFQVLSPIDTTYDLDGDRLVDFQLQWTDSAGKVDPSTARVRSLQGVNGSATPATDLLTVWQVDQQDSAGLSVHETLENLLHGGTTDLEVSVADTAGNLLVDTIQVSVPHGAFLKTITTGLGPSSIAADGITYCPDDNRLYMTANRDLVIFDPDSLRLLVIKRDPYASDLLHQPLCVAGDPVLYVTERVERFDRPTATWLPQATGSFGSVGIIQSRLDPNLIYVGEDITGTVGVIDRAAGARVRQLLQFAPSPEFVADLAVLDADRKLYLTRFAEGGILVVDPAGDSILKRISVAGVSTWPGLGRTDALSLTRSGRWLYAAVIDGLYPGVTEIDTQIDSAVRFLPIANAVGIDLALSPSELRLFVTTQDNGAPSENVLVDLPTWSILETFPRPRSASSTRFDLDVVFHPSGKYLFVAHNLDLDVYLIRE